MDFNARMISSNHLAWPAILSHEFHPVVLPWSSVTSGWFVAKRVELYPAFIRWFQEITWYLFTFDFASPEFWSTAEKASGNFPSVCPTIFWFFELCSALYNTWSSCFLSAHLVSSIFCHFSKCCGCCSFSWAILHLFGGFFPTEWRLNLEAFQNRATVADSEKMFVFGLCIHFVRSPEKFWIQQFAMTPEASPLPAFSKTTLSGSFWVVKYKTVSAILLCFSYSSDGLCCLSKWRDVSMQIYNKSFNIRSWQEHIGLLRVQIKNFLQLFQISKDLKEWVAWE